MIESVSTTKLLQKTSALKAPLIFLGFTFLLIGLGLTIGIIYSGYIVFTQPDQFSTLIEFTNTEKENFIKWVIDGRADSIEFSSIISLIFIAVAVSIIIKTIIAFITMCISSGKSLLNLSRNFDD